MVTQPHPPKGQASQSWSDYENGLRAAAAAVLYPAVDLEACLHYARPLVLQGFPPIYDLDHLSRLVGYDTEYIAGCSRSTAGFYRAFDVPKRSGGVRRISEPLPSLKEIQRWILDQILYAAPVSRFAKAFLEAGGIRKNARFHQRQQIVLSLDIKDFFPSIRHHRIYGLFRSFGYTQEVANTLAGLCTHDDQLPQGAPTSPALSNLVMRRVDRRLGGLSRRLGIRYTRYADDLTFSGDFSIGYVIATTRQILLKDGFAVNEAKTRAMYRHQRQEVTGVVVNDGMRAPRELRRSLRQQMHYIMKFGVGSHLARISEHRGRYLQHLLGIATFVLHLDPTDRDGLHAQRLLRSYLRSPENPPGNEDATQPAPCPPIN